HYEIAHYQKKISGPLLDRIDLHVQVPPLQKEELLNSPVGERSEQVRERVIKARKIQQERYQGLKTEANAGMTSREVRQFCPVNDAGEALLEKAIDRLGLSARSYDRVLKVARTIADLKGKHRIAADEIAEAIQYRSLDRAGYFINC
ncbi:MAG: ATP-binding protein, partial [Halanaerobium sp.]|nr:ATP-binding protein [Halanaerobium sp.]